MTAHGPKKGLIPPAILGFERRSRCGSHSSASGRLDALQRGHVGVIVLPRVEGVGLGSFPDDRSGEVPEPLPRTIVFVSSSQAAHATPHLLPYGASKLPPCGFRPASPARPDPHSYSGCSASSGLGPGTIRKLSSRPKPSGRPTPSPARVGSASGSGRRPRCGRDRRSSRRPRSASFLA